MVLETILPAAELFYGPFSQITQFPLRLLFIVTRVKISLLPALLTILYWFLFYRPINSFNKTNIMFGLRAVLSFNFHIKFGAG